MIVEHGVDVTRYIIHQSWLGDWLMCNRRGLWTAEIGGTPPTEATAIGTAVHAGFEAHLMGADPGSMWEIAEGALHAEFTTPGFRNVKSVPWAKCWQQVRVCVEAMLSQVEPMIASVDTLEHTFLHKVDGRDFWGSATELWIEGTWDCDEGPSGRLWDWKTAGRKYEQWQVDRWYIQPSMYTLAKALKTGDLVSEQTFSYGIALKKSKPEAQILHTRRGPRQWAWLIELMWDAVAQYEQSRDVGIHVAPRNDSGWWCSPEWCHHWSGCRGVERELPALVRGSE